MREGRRWKPCTASASARPRHGPRTRQCRRSTMRDLLRHEHREELLVGPLLAFDALREIAPDSSRQPTSSASTSAGFYPARFFPSLLDFAGDCAAGRRKP